MFLCEHCFTLVHESVHVPERTEFGDNIVEIYELIDHTQHDFCLDFQESDGSSDTEEEIVVTPRAKRQLSKRDTHCICECPRRPENRGRVVVRSRSLSPSHRPQSTSLSRKPPFKAGKADESIISRRSFPNSRGSRSKHRVVVIPEGEPCEYCSHSYKVLTLRISSVTNTVTISTVKLLSEFPKRCPFASILIA